MLPTIIYRHPKENLKKCSLTGLETREELLFATYPKLPSFAFSQYLLLTIEAPILSEEDASLGLFLVDGTWKYAQKIEKTLPPMQKRTLPSHFLTAYPRKQTHCLDPLRGLASIEALYLAHLITKRPIKGLLDLYHWKTPFLEKNKLA